MFAKADARWRETIRRGAYVARDCAGAPDMVIVATGSEVGVALAAADLLADRQVRVVSMMCRERFMAQDRAFREALVPPGPRRVVIEAGDLLRLDVAVRRRNPGGLDRPVRGVGTLAEAGRALRHHGRGARGADQEPVGRRFGRRAGRARRTVRAALPRRARTAVRVSRGAAELARGLPQDRSRPRGRRGLPACFRARSYRYSQISAAPERRPSRRMLARYAPEDPGSASEPDQQLAELVRGAAQPARRRSR